MEYNIIELLKKRRSIRKYLDRPVEEEKVEKLMEAATAAPSAGNSQPWEFIVIENEGVITKLVDDTMSTFNKSWMSKGVPVLIAVCAKPVTVAKKYGDRGRNLYVIQDTAAAIENILISATAMGLGTCWIGAFDEVKASEIMDLGADLRVYGFVTLGYADGEGKKPRQRSLSDVVRYIK
ncbi:nitroreductase family protein [Halonatronum saccharophilum]|uniref:nitroreductase family protein n=1 Tax=Halonatronum saccharophilum TaxID=150060 RepID=UPI0004836EBB|nr:nitroreductase family protein [Halonatronum saccharophilum]